MWHYRAWAIEDTFPTWSSNKTDAVFFENANDPSLSPFRLDAYFRTRFHVFMQHLSSGFQELSNVNIRAIDPLLACRTGALGLGSGGGRTCDLTTRGARVACRSPNTVK